MKVCFLSKLQFQETHSSLAHVTDQKSTKTNYIFYIIIGTTTWKIMVTFVSISNCFKNLHKFSIRNFKDICKLGFTIWWRSKTQAIRNSSLISNYQNLDLWWAFEYFINSYSLASTFRLEKATLKAFNLNISC